MENTKYIEKLLENKKIKLGAKSCVSLTENSALPTENRAQPYEKNYVQRHRVTSDEEVEENSKQADNYFNQGRIDEMQLYPKSSGNTGIGFCFDNGVILATNTLLWDKNLSYLNASTHMFPLTDSIICAATGKSQDMHQIAKLVVCRLGMHRLVNHNRHSLVKTATHFVQEMILKKYKSLATSLIAGVDATGIHLSIVHSCGTSEVVPYATIGISEDHVMTMLEVDWRPDLSEEEAITLTVHSFRYGLQEKQDSNIKINISVIQTDGSVKHLSRKILVQRSRLPRVSVGDSSKE